MSYLKAGTWTAFNVPGAENTTHISGIDGDNIFGSYGNQHGFIYDGTICNTIDVPGATMTEIKGISGNNIVGVYKLYIDDPWPMEKWHGFIYDGTTIITIDKPDAIDTYIYGIDGNIIVGSTKTHGFLYDMTTSTWTTLDYPGAARTNVYGIKGSNLFGSYDNHGFIYDMKTQTWTTIDAPGVTSTRIYGIDDNSIIGKFTISGHGTSFLYNGTNWITDLPGNDALHSPGGISGNRIAGTYYTYYHGEDGLMAYFSHGYIYTIPEPTSAFLVIIGTGILRLHNRKRYNFLN